MAPSAVLAAGPSVTDWRDSTPGATYDADTVNSVPNKLNAVHGRSRPNSPVVADSSTEYEIWAVGDGGVILRNRPLPAVGWEQVLSPTTQNLNDVYINPDGASGWAVGDQGTILRYNGSSWSCVQCPTNCGACGGAGQPATAICTCTDLYSIVPLAPQAASSSLFVVGRAADTPPDNTYGEGWPTVLYFNGTAWTKVTPLTSPFKLDDALGGFYTSLDDPIMTCGPVCIEPAPSISYTGLMIDPFTHISVESTICRQHLQTISSEWNVIAGRQGTMCTEFLAHYYSSAVIGSVPVVGGDTDRGDLFNTLGDPVKTNLFFYNTITQKIQALDTGIAASSSLWGTIRGMDFIPTLRWGIGVGWGPGDYLDIDTVGTKAYFARFDYKDLTRLPAPEDPISPNKIDYVNATSLAAPFSDWPRINDVFISNYNEAWAVGNDGKVLHWLGPPIMPASLKAGIRLSTPGRPVSGASLDVILSVTNTGDTTAINLNPGVVFSPLAASQGIQVALQICGPTCGTFSCDSSPSCAVDLPAGGTASFTWTYTMTACAPYLDRISASIYAADFVTGSIVSASDWIDLSGDLVPPAFQVAVTRSPSGASVPRDAPISYVITVRNTGGVTLSNLTVWDSVAVPITITATGQPAGFSPASNPYYATGRLHYFYNTAPITMTPNTEYSFTLTGIVGRPCALTTVYNRAGACGNNLCTNSSCGTSTQEQFNVPGPAQNVNLVITASRTGGTNPGQPIGYRIVVANGGSATIENLGLLVTDTVPAVVASATRPMPPPGFFELPPADVPGGTWYAWRTIGWTDMAPGETYTFTISGTVGGTCVDVLVSGTPWISGSNFCQSGTYFAMSSAQSISAQTENFLLPGAPPIEFDLSAIQDPATPGPGEAVSFMINIKNVGIPAITSLSVFDTLPAEIIVSDQDSPTSPSFSYSYDTGSNFIAWWNSGLNMANGDIYTFTITGSIGTVCQTTAIDRGFLIDALSGDCGTTGFFTAEAAPYVIPVTAGLNKRVTTSNPETGKQLNFEITLSNTGRVTLDQVTLWDSMPPELMPPAVTFAPPGFTYTRTGWPEGNLVIWSGSGLNLPPGGSINFSLSGTFGITCQATDVINSTWAAAIAKPLSGDSCSDNILASTTASFPIQSAAMAASISLEPEEQVEGNNLVTILLTVSNTGSATTYLTGLTPASDVEIISANPQETVKVSGPNPDVYSGSLRSINASCDTTPCMPQSITFKWVYQTTSIVPITFVASATAGALTIPENMVVCGVTASASTKFSDAGPEGMFALDRNILKSTINHVTVSFNVKEAGRVRVGVYNSVGQKVRSLFDDLVNRRDMFPDPSYSGVKECDARKCPDRLTRCACWDGTNDDGERVASGVYFIRLEARHYVQTRKIAVAK